MQRNAVAMGDARSRRTIACIVAGIALATTGTSRAQEVAGLAETRAVAQCLHAQDEQVQRLVRLIDQAEQRARAPGVAADVRRDAAASIETLVERVRQHTDEARRCLESRIPASRSAVPRVESAPPDPAASSLAHDRGTVHEVESGTPLASGATVVRGERVDGAGSAPDASVRAAVRGIGTRIGQCYDQYLDRAAVRSGELHLSFTANDGGRVSGASVEQAGAFDAAMRQCVERAAQGMTISGQRGRSVYAYTIRFGS
jgi:outer membrane biosynthesis protein TonB